MGYHLTQIVERRCHPLMTVLAQKEIELLIPKDLESFSMSLGRKHYASASPRCSVMVAHPWSFTFISREGGEEVFPSWGWCRGSSARRTRISEGASIPRVTRGRPCLRGTT